MLQLLLALALLVLGRVLVLRLALALLLVRLRVLRVVVPVLQRVRYLWQLKGPRRSKKIHCTVGSESPVIG